MRMVRALHRWRERERDDHRSPRETKTATRVPLPLSLFSASFRAVERGHDKKFPFGSIDHIESPPRGKKGLMTTAFPERGGRKGKKREVKKSYHRSRFRRKSDWDRARSSRGGGQKHLTSNKGPLLLRTKTFKGFHKRSSSSKP